MLPAGIDIAGTAAMPMPASTIPSIVVTWRVSQILGRAGVRCASSRSSSVRLPETDPANIILFKIRLPA